MRLKASHHLKSRIVLVAIFVVSTFLLAPSVLAWDGDTLGRIIGWIIGIFISALGLVLILVIKGLLLIATYQHFIDSQAVIQGWAIVRDLSNMFFVVILLVIAFSTILHLENYSYKKWLPKLILMAVLINFSKTICGLLIDVAQIVMLTFVNAFKDIAGGNIIDMLGIKDIVTMAKNTDGVGFWTIVGAYVLGLIYMIVALVVITTMMMMLVMRLVMIWIYVVLSPLAYLLAAFPGGAQYSSKWWKDFTQNLIVGPVLAFFIWLSFAALQTGNELDIVQTARNSQAGVEQEAAAIGSADTTGDNPVAANKASTPSALIKFVIGIGMLVGGLKIAQEIGGAAGSIAGKGMSKLSSMGAATTAFGSKWAGKIASGDNYLARKTARATGVDIRPFKLAQSWKTFTETSKRKDESEIMNKSRRHFDAGGARSLLGMGVGEDYFHRNIDGFLGYKGLKRAAKETFVNPRRRKELGEKIKATEDERKENIAAKEALIAQKAPEIDQKVNQELATDKSYQKNQSEIDKLIMAILALQGKGNLSDPEKKQLQALETKRTNLEAGQMSKKSEAQSKIIASDVDLQAADKKIEISQTSLNKLKNDIFSVQKPVALQARSAYRSSVEEAKAKYKTETNADKLLKAFKDAEQRGDKFDQVAILEKITSDANFNEVLKSRGYSSDAVGFQKFMDNAPNADGQQTGLSSRLFSDTEKLEVQNDIAEAAERVGHWDVAKMVGMNSEGEMESLVKKTTNANGEVVYDDSAHAKASYAEVMKMDPQKIVNSLNRLAMGGEDANGVFQISTLGKMIYKSLAEGGVYSAQQGRILGNTAASLSQPHIVEILRQIVDAEKELNAVIARSGAGASGKVSTPDNQYDSLNDRGLTPGRK